MIEVQPITIEGPSVRLESLSHDHHDGLALAAADGSLWELRFAAVPEPAQIHAYIDNALIGQAEGRMLPWAVRELTSGTIVGTTRYYDIVPGIDRIEIGFTWYGKRWQRGLINKIGRAHV